MQTYTTSDLALATTLSLFFPIETIDKTNPKRALFVFEKSPDLDKTIYEFYHDTLKIAPQVFFSKLREVKTRLYENIT